MDMGRLGEVVTEGIMMRAVRHLHDRTGMRNLCWRVAWPSTAW